VRQSLAADGNAGERGQRQGVAEHGKEGWCASYVGG
jgi:hypothetical protein